MWYSDVSRKTLICLVWLTNSPSKKNCSTRIKQSHEDIILPVYTYVYNMFRIHTIFGWRKSTFFSCVHNFPMIINTGHILFLYNLPSNSVHIGTHAHIGVFPSGHLVLLFMRAKETLQFKLHRLFSKLIAIIHRLRCILFFIIMIIETPLQSRTAIRFIKQTHATHFLTHTRKRSISQLKLKSRW